MSVKENVQIQQDKINCTIPSNKENEIKIKIYERQCAFKMTMGFISLTHGLTKN